MLTGHVRSSRASTDRTGRCFVSYRRSHSDDVARIIEAMLDLGVPPWQDRRDLDSEPVAGAIKEAIEATSTAGCLFWVSEDFADSPTISRLEAPLICSRCHQDPDFFIETWLADGLPYERASAVFRPAGIASDVSATWNLKQASCIPTVLADGTTGLRIDETEARVVATALLKRRLAKIHEHLPLGEPIRLLLSAHAEAGEAFLPGFGVQINWARHFSHRFAPPSVWSDRLLPALAAVLDAMRASAPGRAIAAEGRATLAACLALGRTFREVTDIPLTWRQKPANSTWSLAGPMADCGFARDQRDHDLGSDELAVLVSVTGDVEPAVVATTGLPRFRALLTVKPTDGSTRRELTEDGQAAHLARLIVGAIREARKELRTINRTHLFIAGPAGLAILVGQLLNAVGPVQTYEHEQSDGVGSYRAAALLTDPIAAP